MNDISISGNAPAPSSGTDAGAQAAPSQSAPVNAPAQNAAPDFYSTLGEHVRDLPSIRTPNFKSVDDMAISVDNLTKLLHGDKTDRRMVPAKGAHQSVWDEFYSSMGKPKTAADYSYNKIEGVPYNEPLLESLKELSHKLHFTSDQFTGLMDYVNERGAETHKEEAAKATQAQQQAVAREDALFSRWGDAAEHNISIAERTAREFMSPELHKELVERGLDKDPIVYEIFYNFGRSLMGEDFTLANGQGSTLNLSPADAQKKSVEMLTDKKSPLHDRHHAGHADAKKEYTRLQHIAAQGINNGR